MSAKFSFLLFLYLAFLDVVFGFNVGANFNVGAQLITVFKLNSITFDITPNPYYGNWSAEIAPDKKSVSMTVPILQDIPDTMTMGTEISYMGNLIMSFDVPICETFDDPIVGKDVTEKGEPSGMFPMECPIMKCADCTLQSYIFPKEKIPPGTPDGVVEATSTFYEKGKDPYVIIHAIGEIKNEIPYYGR